MQNRVLKYSVYFLALIKCLWKTDFLSKQTLYLSNVWKYYVFFSRKIICFNKRNKKKTYPVFCIFFSVGKSFGNIISTSLLFLLQVD